MVNKIYIKDEMLPVYIKQLEHFRALYQSLISTMMSDSQQFKFDKTAHNFEATLLETKALAQRIKKAESGKVYGDVLAMSKKLDRYVEDLLAQSLELTYTYSNFMDLLLGLDPSQEAGINQLEAKLYQAKKQLSKSNFK